jgi:lipoate-protein ligase A
MTVPALTDRVKKVAVVAGGAYHKRVIFGRLRLWMDPVKRSGPEAMAVDEWLLETAETPVLRVYGWLGEWGSVGYFGNLAEARAAFPGVGWVRRWTGGGTVDHRADWTYTVVAPAGEALVKARGAESYRILHGALAEALAGGGIDARLSSGAAETGAAACFENPVSHDIVDAAGRKIAGAGQRRTKHGLLHQGSVAAACDAMRLAASLAENWETHEFHPPADVISAKVRGRYALAAWTARR